MLWSIIVGVLAVAAIGAGVFLLRGPEQASSQPAESVGEEQPDNLSHEEEPTNDGDVAEGDSDSDTEVGNVEPQRLGDDPQLDRLWRACARDDMAACDELYMESPRGSAYEEFGGSCRNLEASVNGNCVETFAPEPEPEPDPFDVRLAQIQHAFDTYVDGINTSDYATAYAVLSDAAQSRTSFAEFSDGNATSVISNFSIDNVEENGPDSVVVVASFISEQASYAGPDGETCTKWSLRYTMRPVGGSWRIDRAEAAWGEGHRTC